MAFWDARVLALLEKWEQSGSGPSPEEVEPEDIDWINDAAKPICLALPPRDAARLAVSIAETVDRRVEELPAEMIARNAAAENPANLSRADHRSEHLDQIEQALRL